MTARSIPAPTRSPGFDLRGFVARNRVQVAITAIFLALWLVYLIGEPRVFGSFNIYRAMMSSLPLFGIAALAMTFVVTLGEIDLSFASIVGISAYAFSTIFTQSGSPELALLGCLAVAAVAGLLNGVLVAKIGIPSIVATIGTMFLWRGLVNLLAQGKGIPLTDLKQTWLHPVLVGKIGDMVPMQFVWMIVFAALLGLLYKRHWFGSHVLFVGDDAASARMMGIRVDAIKIACFVISALFAALAGVFAVAEVTYFYPTQGEGILLTTLAAVFIGGTSVFGGKGTMYGTFIGVLIIGSLESGIIGLGLTGFWVQFLYGLVITLAVTVYAILLKRSG